MGNKRPLPPKVTSQNRENGLDAAKDAENNRATGQQRERTAVGEVGGTELSTRRNSRDSQALLGGQNEVEGYLAGCLLAKNKSEIELSQFAEQQSENPEVKKFAQMMVRDHQKMVQQLQKLAGTHGDTSRQTTRTDATESSDTGTQPDSDRLVENATGEAGIGKNSTSRRSDRTAINSSASETNHGSHGSTSAMQQLAEIDRQIVERQTQATRDDLQQKSGAEFDKAFVGGAIVSHVHMIAALQVIEQQQQGQLAKAAKQARPVAEQHLEHAKQLMEQLESGAAKVGQAERRPAGTQR